MHVLLSVHTFPCVFGIVFVLLTGRAVELVAKFTYAGLSGLDLDFGRDFDICSNLLFCIVASLLVGFLVVAPFTLCIAVDHVSEKNGGSVKFASVPHWCSFVSVCAFSSIFACFLRSNFD